MNHLRAWIFAVSQLYLTLANPIHAPQFLAGGTGRNIRHLPCVSLRSGETGVCMFAFTCVKANGTHLGTCIDRFYFGSCCKLNEETDVYPQDNTIDEGPAASSFVTTDSSIESNDIPDYFTRKPIVPIEKQPSSSTISSSSTLVTTQSVQSETTATTGPIFTTKMTTEAPKIVTKRPYFSTPYTTTQPPMSLSTFTSLHNYSQGSSSSFTTQTVPHSSLGNPTRPLKPLRPESTTVFTTNGGSSRPRPNPSTSSSTRRPVSTETTAKKPSTTSATKPTSSKKPVTISSTRPVSLSTTERTTPPTRFPPRNATATRPVPTSTRKPPTKKPVATTKRPTSATRRPTTTRPSSIVASTTKPTAVTEKPFTTSVKVTQTVKPPITSTQEIISTSGTKPSSSIAGSSTESVTSQRPVTKRPAVTSVNDKIVTTSRPTTNKPSVTTTKPRPSSKPSTIATAKPTTTKIPSKPQQQSTEKIKPASTSATSSSSSRPSTLKPTTTASKRPRPTEKPSKPVKPTKPTKPTRPAKPTSTTSASTATSVETTSTTQATTLSVTSLILNGTTLTNEILPPKISETAVTTEEVTQTTHSSGFVTWSSNSDDDVTKASEVSSTPKSTGGESTTEQWSPITTPDGWIMIESLTTEKPVISDEATTRPKPTKIPTTSVKPTSESATTESITPPKPTIPSILSTIATVTITTDLPVPMETLNMSDYKQVCGRRLFPESRIVGGDDSSFGKWPWQISLRQWRSKSYLHKCGAALLNENWAITAAHCVENVPPSDLLLRLGEHDLANEDEPYGFQERRVQIVASHPQFDPRTFEYDLALLRFYEPLEPFQPNLLPICLPDDDENYVGHTAYVTGWGRLYEDGILPSVLQEVSVPVINNTVCEGMYRSAGYIEHIPHIFICAGWRKGGYDSCEGDSGGPMVIQRPRDKRWILAGVISWGIGCAEPNQPGVYTRISEFREWINQILQF